MRRGLRARRRRCGVGSCAGVGVGVCIRCGSGWVEDFFRLESPAAAQTAQCHQWQYGGGPGRACPGTSRCEGPASDKKYLDLRVWGPLQASQSAQHVMTGLSSSASGHQKRDITGQPHRGSPRGRHWVPTSPCILVFYKVQSSRTCLSTYVRCSRFSWSCDITWRVQRLYSPKSHCSALAESIPRVPQGDQKHPSLIRC